MAKSDDGGDLKELRGQFESDFEDWADAREMRAKCMRALAGDPWDPTDRQQREDAGRPCLTFDELTQHVNQVVNDFRANPLSVEFEPGTPANETDLQMAKKAAQTYGDAMREMEYRCNGPEVYTTAAENGVQGGYGFVRLVNEFVPGTFEQRLVLKSVPDPNTVVPAWNFQNPDLSDMRRCWVLERRPWADVQAEFPKAKRTNFGDYVRDADYSKWVDQDSIQLAEHWCVKKEPVKLLLVQPPTIQPPSGGFGFRPAQARPPIAIKLSDWDKMPPGSKVISEREDTESKVYQQIVNGIEILKETTWPGPYIPIAGCMGRILYTDDSGKSKRLLMSAVWLALDPFMSYCFYRTSEIENVGMTTKNPYWAYEGQLDAIQQTEIAKSLHEPVAVLFAKAKTESSGNELLPLPQRNVSEPAIQALSVGAEECRRAVLSALGESALPTSAQRQNEKSRVALDKIDQSRQKGTYHFFDHYKGMVRHVGKLFEAAFDTFHDTTGRKIAVRKPDQSTAHVTLNDPQNPDAIDVRGSYAVTVSTGPHVDSTREAGSDFADMLLSSEALMSLLGPEKSQQIAALAVKLKVDQTGIGAIGQAIIDIITPPADENLTPEQIQQQNQQLKATVQQMQKMLQQAQQDEQSKIAAKKVELQGKYQIASMQEDAESQRAAADREVKLAVAELGAKMDRMALFMEERARLGVQAHESTEGHLDRQHDLGMAAADAEHAKGMAAQQALTALASPQEPPQAAGGA